MKRSLKISSKFVNSIVCLLTVFQLSCSVLSAQSYKVFAASDLVRIFEDGYKIPVPSDTIKLFGIGGEIISGQFVLNAKKSLTDVTVELSPFKNTVSGSALPSIIADWNFVGTIPLSKNTPNQPIGILTRPAPANFPDYLMAEKQVNIKEKTYKAVWLTINIPENSPSGNYLGKVTVKSNLGNQSLPVFLTIYPLNLPSERHLKVIEWYNTSKFDLFHGIKEEYSEAWFAMLKTYAENMAVHRQNVFQVPMDVIEITKSKTNELEFNFTRFDQIAQVFWNTGKMDFLETGELTRFNKKEWSGTEVLLRNFHVKNSETGEKITMEGKDVIPYLLPAFESHLRQKGWLHKTHFGVKDEPSMHNSVAYNEVSSYIHKYAPDLIRMDAIETTNVLSEIELAIPKLDAFANWYNTYKDWQKKGNELWFYTVGIYQGSLFPNKTIDMPLIDSRIMHWLNYKYDATGYLHWGWNQWTDNPYLDPDIHIGDGWHVYPVKNGVLNSMRWEEMRNGIQDYEYFWMLENKITKLKESLGSRFSWIDPKQRGKEIAGSVVMGFAEHTNDPLVLYKAKLEIIRELMDLDISPKIYVQTNPLENSTMTNNSSVEIYGWTEPGTRIIINGTEIPVSKQGLFLEQLGGEFIDTSKIGLGKRIKIEAINANGSKEIFRDFLVK